MLKRDINLFEAGIDLMIGFNTGTTPVFIPSPDLVTIEASMKKVTMFANIEDIPLQLEPCNKDGLYDFDKVENDFVKQVNENALCFLDKTKLNVSGKSDTMDSTMLEIRIKKCSGRSTCRPDREI